MKLQVPVGLYITDHDTVLIIHDGMFEERPLPIKPFMFETVDPAVVAPGDELNHIIGEQTAYIRKVFYPTLPMKLSMSGKTYIPKLDYVLDLLREYPDLVTGLCPDGCDIYPQFMDIETASQEGRNSHNAFNPDVAECVSIQLAYPDSEDMVLSITSQYSEKQMLHDYIELTRCSQSNKTPDMIVGYNHSRFDVPFLRGRALNLGLKDEWDALERTKKLPSTNSRHGGLFYPAWMRESREGEMIDFVPGLLNLDLFLQVKGDQSKIIKALPSKTLKAVSVALGAPDVVDLEKHEKMDMRGLLRRDPDRFMKYAKSDLIQTRYLYNIYVNRLIASANLLTVPLSMIHFMSSGQQSHVALYRECRKHKYYSFTRNSERYNYLLEKGKYQGAIVGCYKQGYFHDIMYVDAKSMYPNIMYDFNVSYDRYKVEETIEFKDWTDGDPNIIRSYGPLNARTVLIPDENYQMIFKFKIDMENPGFMKNMITYYNTVRDQYKHLMKDAKKKYKTSHDINDYLEANNYDSQQQAAKIVNNTFYGLQGDRTATFGDLAAGILITSIGRWITTQIEDLCGDSLLEIDTDGAIVDKTKFKYTVEEFNEIIKDRMVTTFGIPKSDLKFEMEYEGKGAMYLYAMKNYVYRDDLEGKLIVKGSAFTGYGKAQVIKDTVQCMANTIMYGEFNGVKLTYADARAKCMDIRNRPIEDFRFTSTVRRAPEEYKGYGNIEVYARQIPADIEPAERVKAIKKRARDWIGSTIKDKTQQTELLSYITASKTEDQLLIILKMLSSLSKKENTQYAVLHLIMRKLELGYDLQEDDALEYYYTLTPEKVTLAEETKPEMLDYQRYLTDINSALTCFEHADPDKDAFNLW